jgi:Cu(I)/Ag(I) efflux system membrane fusion protein
MLIVVAVAGAFFAGRWYAAKAPRTPERKVLYWVDPMHPAYKSDKPGIAPDCGMKLVPVYADETLASALKTVPGTTRRASATFTRAPRAGSTRCTPTLPATWSARASRW